MADKKKEDKQTTAPGLGPKWTVDKAERRPDGVMIHFENGAKFLLDHKIIKIMSYLTEAQVQKGLTLIAEAETNELGVRDYVFKTQEQELH